MTWMAKLGETLIDAGFHILPLYPGEKFPGVYSFGQWHPMRNWGRYAERMPSPLELHHWAQWPGAGIGIVGGNVVAIDIDVLDADIAYEIDRHCQEKLGDTPALRIGQEPKRLRVYRTKVPFRGNSFGSLEVLCDGRQFVGYGIHPRTKQPYTWPDESLADLDVSDLPVAESEAVADFVASAALKWPDFVQARPLPMMWGRDDRRTVRSLSVSQRGTPAAVRVALKYIPNTDLHYDDWIRIGLAVKGALGEDGWELFDEWSGRSQKYDQQTTARKWLGLTPMIIGAGAVYRLARQNGWTPPASLQLDGDASDRRRRLNKFQTQKG